MNLRGEGMEDKMKDELRDKIKDLIIKKTGSLSFLDEDLSSAIADYITRNFIPKNKVMTEDEIKR